MRTCSRVRRVISVTILGSIAILSAWQQVLAQDAGAALAFERASHLRRGINASNWFSQTPDYSAQQLTTFITADDFGLIHQLGLDHVRLPIDPALLLHAPLIGGLNADYLALLDGAVKEILDNQLDVVLDIQAEDDYKHSLQTDRQAREAFVDFWSAFAAHYAATDPERVFFEILNEPEISDPGVWAGLEVEVVSAIRKAAPLHTIIATAGIYSDLGALLKSQPISDRNVIYTFHDYEPFAFTHQGATWTMGEVRPLSQIPYPSTPENIAPKLAEEPDLAGQFWLNGYGLEQWNAARIASQIAFARKWSEQYHVPVWCGEFGVFRDHSDPGMRAAWLNDMRVALEQNGIGWAMWDYRAAFALAPDVKGKRVADPLVVKALGLNPVR